MESEEPLNQHVLVVADEGVAGSELSSKIYADLFALPGDRETT
jgi:hypothetical protein